MDFDTYFAMQWYEKQQQRKQRHREEYRAMLKRQQEERAKRLLPEFSTLDQRKRLA